MVQNPPCWRASFTLGHPKQRKCKFVLMKSLCSGCPSGQLALQHGGVLYHVTASCKGPIVLNSRSNYRNLPTFSPTLRQLVHCACAYSRVKNGTSTVYSVCIPFTASSMFSVQENEAKLNPLTPKDPKAHNVITL